MSTMIVSDTSTSEFKVQSRGGVLRHVSIVAWRVTDEGVAEPVCWPALKPGDTLHIRVGANSWQAIDAKTGASIAAAQVSELKKKAAA